MMFKRKGGGVKGLLNNVKKKLHFSYVSASLKALVNMLRIEDPKVTQSSKKERFREHAVGGMKP